jgi:hypothetical protein
MRVARLRMYVRRSRQMIVLVADRNRAPRSTRRVRLARSASDPGAGSDAFRGPGRGLFRHAARKPVKAPSGDQTLRRIVTLACARGGFRSMVELPAGIHRYIAEHNDHPKPSTWTKPRTDPRQAESYVCVSSLTTGSSRQAYVDRRAWFCGVYGSLGVPMRDRLKRGAGTRAPQCALRADFARWFRPGAQQTQRVRTRIVPAGTAFADRRTS